MRSVIYWLMGDRAGRVIFASWNWLWGKPVEQGGKIAVEVAQESLWSMQESVHQLTESVSKAVTAYERAKQQYIQKQEETKRSEKLATQAFEQGHEEAARLAMTRTIELERVLPRFAEQVEKAEQSVQSLKDKLHQERQKLESYQVQMQTLKALAEVNEALAVIADVNGELKIDSARNQFQEAQAAIEGRNIQVNAFQQLSESLTEKMQSDLDRMSLDSEIEQRLKRLKSTQSN
jgi:phage shock protein A